MQAFNVHRHPSMLLLSSLLLGAVRGGLRRRRRRQGAQKSRRFKGHPFYGDQWLSLNEANSPSLGVNFALWLCLYALASPARTSVCIHIYIYIYIYRERERCVCMYIYIYIYIYIHTCVYTHIHICVFNCLFVYICLLILIFISCSFGAGDRSAMTHMGIRLRFHQLYFQKETLDMFEINVLPGWRHSSWCWN